MRILLLGSGAREHAIGWKLAASPSTESLISVPGNPGLAEVGRIDPTVDPCDRTAVLQLAEKERIELVVVGPEAPLAAGVSDVLRADGIPVFGPSRSGARLESSKAFAKALMAEAGVPTAAADVFDDLASALAHLDRRPGPYVVKADGLAAGKGVLVTEDRDAAMAWVERCFGGDFGEAGRRVVIEEALEGPEVSVFAICDGETAVALEPARDYKRLLDGDDGPNTGGMGSYSPVDDLPDGLVDWTLEDVVTPVLDAMGGHGDPYIGFLYVGLMLTADGPKVLEFNCRLGDPEGQVLLPRLETDLVSLLSAAAHGDLGGASPAWSSRAVVNVVLAADGYPAAPRTGAPISGLHALPDGVIVFHAGTAMSNGSLVTAGGRVLNVVASGESVADARRLAYEGAEAIDFTGKHFRTDIAGGS